MKGNAGLFIIVLLAIGFLIFTPQGASFLQSVGLGSTIETTISQCDSTTTPDWDPEAYDHDNVNTAMTEATNIYRKVGSTKWSSFTQGTAVTGLTVGATYEAVFGISASDFVDNAYGPYLTFTAPCAETVSGWAPDGGDDVALYDDAAETTLTATFYNEDNNAAAQTFSAGQQKTVHLKWVAPVEDYYGNPYLPGYPNVLCLDLNTTTMDEPLWVKVNGVEMSRVATPIRHSGASGKTTYCYEAPIVSDEEVVFDIRLKADDTTAPAVDDTAYLYAANWFIHSETGAVMSGVEDDDGNAVGTDSPDSLTLDFT